MTNHLNRITRINPADPHDLALWALVLDVSPATVEAAVHLVGTDAAAVQTLITGRPADPESGD